ncbi:MAG: tRNA (mo5U34)-methyltransferase [Methylobacteriaceae bacterium]|nr:tRNA (mo5U34)-methyltransferase [Methylobacteriaceae bacterium]
MNARLLDGDRTDEQIKALGPWFHNMNLNGVWTAPDHPLGDYPAIKWNRFAAALPVDLSGKSVLDIGCNGGFYSIEMKRRGARRVVGIDHDPDYLAQARFAADVLRLDIEFHQLSVFDVALLGERFDVVIFMGVLYHLRHPLLALDLIRAHAADDMLIFQSMQRGSKDIAEFADDYPITEIGIFDQPDYPKLHFIENRYAHDPTNWFVPNRAGAEAMLRSAGFVIEAHPEEEVYICRCGPQTSDAAVYPPKRAAP